MTRRELIRRSVSLAALSAACSLVSSAPADPAARQSLQQGATFPLGSRRFELTKLDTLPYVENDYSRRFKFDAHDNPKLKLLRERYRLDDVVAPGRGEFDRQVLLLDWAHRQFKSFGRPTSPARGALDILDANDAGHTFFCAHYADVFLSAAAAMGWVDRKLALRRPDHVGSGSTEHSSTEIWSNQHRKWVMFDPTFAMYAELDGVPLNAYELRQAWFGPGADDLVFVIGKERQRRRKADMPVFRNRFAGFGDLTLDPSGLNVYAFIGYIPNTNLMDAGPDYGRMFITQDAIGGATKWHKRDVPADPANEPYFPINQASLSLTVEGDALRVNVKTLTPNFKTYLARFDAGEWKPVGESFTWSLRDGRSRLEVKSVNHFGVEGPVSTAEPTTTGP